MQYEQDENCKLNRKTGLSTRSFHFAGRNLEGLINELGETSVTALVDPDDFRFAYIPLDDGARLVKLINRWTDDRTPAYSFERAKEIFNGVPKDNPGKEIQDAFWRDLYALATETSPSPGQTKRSTRQESKETTKRSKDHAAVQRAAKNPIQPASTESPGSATDPVGNVVWSDDPIGVFNVNSYKPGKGGLGT